MKKKQKTAQVSPDGAPAKAGRFLDPFPQIKNQPEHNGQLHHNGHLPEDMPGISAELLKLEIKKLRETMAHYQDRFDYTPVGSLIIDGAGLIYEANLTFSQFVNTDRNNINLHYLEEFFSDEQKPVFLMFLRNLQEIPGKQTCEILLNREAAAPLEVRLEGLAMPTKPGEEPKYRVAIMDITDQKSTERQLIESRLFVQKIADTMPDILTVYDTQARKNLYGNREIFTTLGLDLEKIKKTDVQVMLELVHPDDLVGFQQNMMATRQLRDGEVSQFEYRIKNGEGKYVWLNVRTVVFQRLATGEVSQILSIQEDITFKKEAEEAIRYKDQVITGLLNNLPVVVTLVAPDGTILAMTGSGMKALENVGRSISIGDNLYQQFPGLWSNYQTVFQTRKKVSFQYCLPDDPDAWFQNYIFLDEAQNAAICFSIDISEQIAARKKAMTEREFSQTLLDNSMDGILAYDTELRFTAWNKVMEKNTHLPKEAILGKRIFDLFPDLRGTELGKAARKVLQGKSVVIYNQRVGINADQYEIYLNPLKQENGKAIGALCVLHNVNAQKKLEAEATQVKLDQQKTVINAVLATQEEERRRIAESLHNGLAQLLYAAKLNLNRLNTDPKANSETLALLNELLEDSIKEVRTVSFELMPRILEDFGLETALQELLKRINGPSLKIQQHTNGLKRFPVEIEVAVYRIIQELINNIIKHAKASLATIEVTCQRNRLQISAKDNGIGFDHKSVEEKTKGIGLTSIASRVKLLNGDMIIESAPGFNTLIAIEIELPTLNARVNK